MSKRNIFNVILLVSVCTAWSLAENVDRHNLGLRFDLMPIPTEIGVGVAAEYSNCFGTIIPRTELAMSGGALFIFDIDIGYGYPFVLPFFTLQPELYLGYSEMGTYWVEHGINIATKLRFEKSIKRWSFSLAPSLRYSNLYNWVSFSTDCSVKYDFFKVCK